MRVSTESSVSPRMNSMHEPDAVAVGFDGKHALTTLVWLGSLARARPSRAASRCFSALVEMRWWRILMAISRSSSGSQAR